MRQGEPALLLDDRTPGLQEIGPERDDVAGSGEVVHRELVEPEDVYWAKQPYHAVEDLSVAEAGKRLARYAATAYAATD